MNAFRSLWWWAALIAGGSYCLPAWGEWSVGANGPVIVAWKGAGVGLLSCWLSALGQRRLATVLALGALGDVLLARFGLVVGALAFAAGHGLAIHTYLNRARLTCGAADWRPFALLVPLSLAITYLLLRGQSLAPVALAYAALVAGMAAAAWQSRYPRALTGLGALLFLVSDWLIFAGQALPQAHDLARFAVWPLYFGGQALIAAGIAAGTGAGTAATTPASPR